MVKRTLIVEGKEYIYHSLYDLEFVQPEEIDSLPFSVKVLLEAAIRQCDGKYITRKHVKQLAQWKQTQGKKKKFHSNRRALSYKTLRVFRRSWT